MNNYHGTDFTYCASKNCQNKCGRKLTMSVNELLRLDDENPGWRERLWYADFCDEDGELKHNERGQ